MLESIARTLTDGALRNLCLRWLAMIAQNVDGWRFGGDLHGQNHWSRTLALALAIGRAEGFSDADLDCLSAAAAFHDARRLDEFLDTGHGIRGADYYAAFCAEKGLRFDPRAWLAIAWHDRDDGAGIAAARHWDADHSLRSDDVSPEYGRCAHPEWPGFSEEGWSADAVGIVRAFKDADALDRLRMGTWALDPSYLRLDSSKDLVAFAEGLVFKSLGPGAAELGANGAPVLRPVPSKVPGVDEDAVRWDAGVSQAAPAAKPLPFLVAVDIQNDFVDGALGSAEAMAALPAMVEKVGRFDGTVVFTKDTHDGLYLQTQEGSALPVEHCRVGTHGWELAPGLAELQRERRAPVYLKGTFAAHDLACDLAAARARGALESVELIGLCTDICVVSNALLIKALLPDVPVRVDGACCAGVTPESHEAALLTMQSCQIEVV